MSPEHKPSSAVGPKISELQVEPTPTFDRLAPPVMPEQPTQLDMGRLAYYHHCMPCHGDQGQGLTDEWREVWVEDHRNCWARGCHGGGVEDEGFPLSPSIPAIDATSQVLERFPKAHDLHEYLQNTHPPQRPGALTDDEYQALTLYVRSRLGQGDIGRDGSYPDD